jgi:predicted MFS family arabinose efflux permease
MFLRRAWINSEAGGAARPALPLFLLATAAFLSAAGARSIDPLLGILARDFQTSVSAVSVMVATFTLAYGGSQLFLGPIADRFGKLRVLLGALAAYAVFMLACAHSRGLTELTVFRALAGAASGGLVPTCLAYLGDWVPYERRQVMLNHIFNGYLLGQMLAGPVGGILGQWLGWRSVFLLLAGAGGLAAAVLALRRTKFSDRRATLVLSYGRHHGKLATDRNARRLMIGVFIEGATMAGSFPFIAPFLTHAFALTYAASGAVLTLFGIGAFIYTRNAKLLLSRLGETGLVILGGILVVTGFTTAATSPVWQLIILAELVLGLGYFTLHSVLQTRATELLPEARATAVSGFVFMLFTGQSLGVLMMGGTIALLGYRPAFAINAAAIVALVVWLRKLLGETEGVARRERK